MNRLFISSFVLLITGYAFAQEQTTLSLDTLYEQGPRHLAGNWRPFGTTHKAAVFLHNDVKKADQDYIAVWRHNELRNAEYFEKEKLYFGTRERVVVDCKNSKVGVSDLSSYAERFGRGEIVTRSKFANPDMQEAMPDSLEEQLVKTVCSPKPRNAPARKTKATKAATN